MIPKRTPFEPWSSNSNQVYSVEGADAVTSSVQTLRGVVSPRFGVAGRDHVAATLRRQPFF